MKAQFTLHGYFSLSFQVRFIAHENGAPRQHHLVLLQVQQDPLRRLESFPIHNRVRNHKQIDAVSRTKSFHLHTSHIFLRDECKFDWEKKINETEK